MTLERITESSIGLALRIQEELFPGESARVNYEESLSGQSGYEYDLIVEDGVCVGIIGLYCYPEDPSSAWLGWFGIRKPYRRRHLGSAALKMFEEKAAAEGYRFARLYTDAVNNDTAIAFYKANGYTGEMYLNEQDPACKEHQSALPTASHLASIAINSFCIPTYNRISENRSFLSRHHYEPL